MNDAAADPVGSVPLTGGAIAMEIVVTPWTVCRRCRFIAQSVARARCPVDIARSREDVRLRAEASGQLLDTIGVRTAKPGGKSCRSGGSVEKQAASNNQSARGGSRLRFDI